MLGCCIVMILCAGMLYCYVVVCWDAVLLWFCVLGCCIVMMLCAGMLYCYDVVCWDAVLL